MARIRNRLDPIIEQMISRASVADQLTFQSWPAEAQAVARKAVGLEIDKAAENGSDDDAMLADAVMAVRVHFGELKANVERFAKLVIVPGAGNTASDAGVAHAKMVAELAEMTDVVRELEAAAKGLTT